MTARVAAYYAPETDDPLWSLAACWLGRDPLDNAPRAQPALAGIAVITEDARRYGFHATLKPPMALRPGVAWPELLRAARAVAASVPAFALPALEVADLDGFLALRETGPSPALQAFSDACVAGLDGLRAPPSATELARRRAGGLGPAQEANLVLWGYPHVFATWFFHMTLTCRLDPADAVRWRHAAAAHFAPALGPRRIASLCLFAQAGADAPFVLAERLRLA